MHPSSKAVQMLQVPRQEASSRSVVLWMILASILAFAAEALGQTVLVAGGAPSLSGPYTSTAEMFDPTTNTWNFTANNIPNAPPDIDSGLCAPNMVLLGNGKVLLAGGGCTDTSTTTNASSLYDPTTNQWTATGTAIPNFMNYGRDQFGMVTLNSGNAFAFDGCAGGCEGPNILNQGFSSVGKSAEIYTYQTNTWAIVSPAITGRGNFETSNLNQGTVVLQDGRVLACNGSDGGTGNYNTCEIYDPGIDSWSATGSIGTSSELGVHQMILLSSGKVLTVLDDGFSASLFDPISGTWNPTGSLTSMQVGGQLVKLSDGRVLDCGGHDPGGIPISTAQIYDPTSGQWSTANSMTTGRLGHVAVLLSDSRVLVAGGEDPGSVILSSAEIFNPSTGSWSVTGAMNLQRFSANALLIGNFSQQTYVLTVSTNGSGTVISMDGGINCPGTCGNSYPVNTQVTLNAMPAQGWSFAGWNGGGCSGIGPCIVTMTQDQSVTAMFTQNTNFYTLSVATSGSGTVTSTDANINCPGVCSFTYPVNTLVTLNNHPGQGGIFLGWNGACTGTGPCNVTMTQNQFVTASFNAQPDIVTHNFGNGDDGQKPLGQPDFGRCRQSLRHHLYGRSGRQRYGL